MRGIVTVYHHHHHVLFALQIPWLAWNTAESCYAGQCNGLSSSLRLICLACLLAACLPCKSPGWNGKRWSPAMRGIVRVNHHHFCNWSNVNMCFAFLLAVLSLLLWLPLSTCVPRFGAPAVAPGRAALHACSSIPLPCVPMRLRAIFWGAAANYAASPPCLCPCALGLLLGCACPLAACMPALHLPALVDWQTVQSCTV